MLSVVMLVRDRMRLTQQALRSLVLHTQEQIEITVVDDASQPETQQWLREWCSFNRAQLIRNEESRGTGWARNQGIAAAREKFGTDNLLYLSDNDTYFLPKWDEVVLDARRTYSTYKIIGGGCHPFLQPTRTEPLRNTGHWMISRDAVSGYSWLLDWETWDRFGPLDSHALGVRQSEDWAMCQKVRQAGYAVGSVVPEVVVHVGLTDTFGEHPPGWELIDKNRVEGVIYE